MRSVRRLSLATAALTPAGLFTAVAAQPAAAEDSMCRTTHGGRSWYPGPSAGTTYDRTFHSSVAIPAGLFAGRYVPQGLAYRTTGTARA